MGNKDYPKDMTWAEKKEWDELFFAIQEVMRRLTCLIRVADIHENPEIRNKAWQNAVRAWDATVEAWDIATWRESRDV